MHRKRFETTDVDVLGEGELLGFASTFGNTDRVGDRVVRGAFADSVRAIKAGKRIPLVWQHDYAGSPQNWVGRVTDAQETDEGLIIRAEFDLDDPAGRKAWKLARDGDVGSLSIGYSVPRGGSRRGKDGVNELHRVDLHEVSVVLVPANEQARILAVKGDDDRDDLEHDDDLDRIRQEGADLIAAAFAHADATADDRDDALREKSQRYIAELSPVRVRPFDC